MLSYSVKLETDSRSSAYDGIVLIGTSLQDPAVEPFAVELNKFKDADKTFESNVTLIPFDGRRLIYSPTGPLNRDQDDIRAFSDAAEKGVKRALSSGCQNLLVVLPKKFEPFTDFNVDSSCVLGTFYALYVPLEIREDCPDRKKKVDSVGFVNFLGGEKRMRYLQAVESGRCVARDIGGSDPERMCPPNVAKYIESALKDSKCVKVEVIDKRDDILKAYPLLAAVDRCASHVERHRARMVLLTYTPEDGKHDETLGVVGKGVTYDTGGADVKAGGHMAGMHRDKCGAASVGGLFQTLSILKPRGVKVYGAMCMVRNSIGSDSYVADELMTSRAGVRVRIGNTDAEGRMAMVDALAQMKERLINEPKPQLFTIATLTGHACLAVGSPFAIILDNGPAKKSGTAQRVQAAGDEIGELFEMSTLRREDFEFIVGKSEYEDVLQCNNAPSSQTPRGHQFPAAFLVTVSGLDKHGKDSKQPLAYSHIDIAAADGPFPGVPSGCPVAALTQAFLLNRV